MIMFPKNIGTSALIAAIACAMVSCDVIDDPHDGDCVINQSVVFCGYERSPFGEGPIAIKRDGDRYWKVEWFTRVDGSTDGPDGLATPMIVVPGPHPDSLPRNTSLVLAHQNGIGRPDWRWVLVADDLVVFRNCKRAPCDLIRTIRGTHGRNT